jgi:hypothetical protein
VRLIKSESDQPQLKEERNWKAIRLNILSELRQISFGLIHGTQPQKIAQKFSLPDLHLLKMTKSQERNLIQRSVSNDYQAIKYIFHKNRNLEALERLREPRPKQKHKVKPLGNSAPSNLQPNKDTIFTDVWMLRKDLLFSISSRNSQVIRLYRFYMLQSQLASLLYYFLLSPEPESYFLNFNPIHLNSIYLAAEALNDDNGPDNEAAKKALAGIYQGIQNLETIVKNDILNFIILKAERKTHLRLVSQMEVGNIQEKAWNEIESIYRECVELRDATWLQKVEYERFTPN